MLGRQQLDLVALGLQGASPVMCPSASFNSHQRWLTVGEELGYLGALEFAPLYFTCLDVHDVELKDVFGNIHSNDG